MFDMPQSTIRFWESQISILSPKRVSGVRKYTPKDIDSFKIVYHLIRDKGLKVSAVDRFLSTKPAEGILASAEVVEKLEKLKSTFQKVLYLLEEDERSGDDTSSYESKTN